MRRIITFFVVILLTVICYSCNSKDNEKTGKKSENTVVGEFNEEKTEENTNMTKDIGIFENTTSVSAANSSGEERENISEEKKDEFIFYNATEFKDLKVMITPTNKQLPLDIKTIDISELNMGERIPILNKDEYFEKIFANNSLLISGEKWSDRKDRPEKAHIERIFRLDKKVYIVATYGSVLDMFYEWAVFCYDTETMKSKEIFSWSSDLRDKKCCGIEFYHGKLFYCISESKKSYVKEIDLSSKQEKIIFEKDSSEEYSMYLFDKSYFFLLNDDATEQYTYYELEDRFLSQEEYLAVIEDRKAKLNEKMQDIHIIAAESFVSGEGFCFYSEKFLGEPICSEKDRFIFSTGYSVDTFDTTKMEHYTSSLDDIGLPLFAFGGKIFLRDGNNVKCFVPDMGLVYNVLENVKFDNAVETSEGIICDLTNGNEKIYVLN